MKRRFAGALRGLARIAVVPVAPKLVETVPRMYRYQQSLGADQVARES